jgi:hypothetical protein
VFRVDQSTLFLSQSLAANFTSPSWDVRGMFAGCLELAWTGVDSATCSFKLQGSGTGAVWCDLEDSSYSIAATGAGDQIYEWSSPVGFNQIRLVFTAGSNTAGTMTGITITKYERNGDAPGRGL